jgi:hypothetical protein
MGRAVLFVVAALAGCSRGNSRADSSDTAFALVQARGHTAMGVDQYTSTHTFEPLPDGGRITLVRNSEDSAGVAQIRRHLHAIASGFAQGNFELPGFVHDRVVPGTAVMARLQSHISYTADSLPRGGQLRIRSADSAAVTAIHEFLAFQRQDHRSGAGTSPQ